MDPAFEVHTLNEEGIKKATAIAEDFDLLMVRLSTYCGQGREWSVVRTKLEEACFWAKKSMASVTENQKPPEPNS